MTSLMRADELEPLVPIQHTEGWVRVADDAETQAVVRDNQVPQRLTGLVEGGERRRGVHLASGKDAVARGDASATVEKKVPERVDDWAGLPLWSEHACESGVGQLGRQQSGDLLLHAPEMLEHLRHRPAVGGGTRFAKR